MFRTSVPVLRASALTVIFFFGGMMFFQPEMKAAAVAPASFAAAETPQQQADRRTHTVQSRETLFGIARRYEVTVQNLRDWNTLESDALREGQQLFIEPPRSSGATPSQAPTRTPAEGTADGRRVHTVAQSQTMFSISRQYGVTVQQLLEWNNLTSPDLRIGQQIFVEAPRTAAPPTPTPTPAPTPPSATTPTAPQPSAPTPTTPADRLALDREGPRYTYHTVRAGETLSGIARQHNISLTELRNFNNISGDVISVGQRLVVGREVSAPRVTGLGVESTAQGRFFTHTVQRNETLSSILRTHQMDEKDFQALNPGLTAQDMRAGLELVLLAPPTVNHANPYRVRNAGAAGNSTRDTIPATVYSSNMRGMVTTSGELYNPAQLTAAHPNLPLGSVVHLHNPDKNLGIFVLINDRTTDNRIRLSDAAFRALRLAESESPRVLIDTRTDSDS